MLRFGEGRFDEALAEFAAAQGLERLLAGEHVFAIEVRGRALQVRVRMGDTRGRERALAGVARNSATAPAMRIALAALELEQDDPEQADRGAGAGHRRLGAGAVRALGARRGARCSTPGPAIASATGARRRSRSRRRSSSPSPKGCSCPSCCGRAASCSSATPGTGRRTRRCSRRSSTCSPAAPRLSAAPAAPLRDSLSEAELRVVGYLPSNLTASEIASELVVSTNTVRTHMRHIYAKLDAHTRSEAVARARELGLVAPGTLRG